MQGTQVSINTHTHTHTPTSTRMRTPARGQAERVYAAPLQRLCASPTCMWPPTPSSRPKCTHIVRTYVPASQLIQNTAKCRSSSYSTSLLW